MVKRISAAERREAGLILDGFPQWRLRALGLIFGVEADGSLETRKKFRLNGRGCIFSRPPIVQVVSFRPVFDEVDPGAVRLR
jgi:hypothetical protein